MEPLDNVPVSMWRFIRNSFVGVTEERLFFNNAAGAMRLKNVLELQQKLVALPDYPSDGAGQEAKYLLDVMEEGKQAVRTMLDAPTEGDIIQDLSASRLLFSLVDTAARVGRGRNIVTTELDHPAAIDGTRRAAEKYGMKAVIVPVDQTLHSVTEEQVLAAVTEETSVLMMTCTSNSTGAKLPYKEIVRAVRAKYPELYIILDGVQRLPHGSVGLKDISVDGLVIAPYKVFSSRGSGLAWVSNRLALAGEECLIGQKGSAWTLGSVDPVSFALMKEVANYFEQLGYFLNGGGERRLLVRSGQDYVEEKERVLHELMMEGTEQVPGLRHIPGIKVWFDQENLENKDWIVCISGSKQSTDDLYQAYLKKKVVLSIRRQNSIYCSTLLKSYGCGDVLRISPMHYYDKKAVLQFLNVTREIVGET